MEFDQETSAPTPSDGDNAIKQGNSETSNEEKQIDSQLENQLENQTETPAEAQSETASEERLETEVNQEPPLEEQSTSTFITYTREEMNAFMLKPEDVDNPEMKDAAISLMHEAKFPCMEMHKVLVMKMVNPEEVTLVFDHQNKLVRVGDLTIKSRQIRFACLNRIEKTKTGYEVVVSYFAEENTNRLLHLLNTDNPRSLVASLNNFRRLIYTIYKEMSATVKEFETALRQTLPIFTGSLEGLSVYNLNREAYELQNSCMYLYLDSECLMILQSQFLEDSPYQMFFWKEAVTGSVDRVMILHGKETLHIETDQIRLETPKYKEEPAKFVFDCIRRLRPEPQGSFTDHGGRLEKIRYPFRTSDVSTPSRSVSSNGETQREYYYDNRVETDTIRLKTFRDELSTAVIRMENQEEIALPWVIAEDEIKRMLDEGFVPETDILSGGLDPNNLDHFMKCEEEIEHQLVKQQYDKALSRLQGTKEVFTECKLQEMRILLSIDDVTLLKQMYFHSFT